MSTSSTEPLPSPHLLLEIGHIARAHGVRGEVVVALSTDRTERMVPGAVLYARVRGGGDTARVPIGDDTDRASGQNAGDLVRLVVTRVRPHQDRWIASLDGIHDRNGAEALRGSVLLAEAIDDPDAMWVHDLVGKVLVDQTGTGRGRVVALEANPASDLIVLDTGGLVPVAFVVEVNDETVRAEVPAGLFAT